MKKIMKMFLSLVCAAAFVFALSSCNVVMGKNYHYDDAEKYTAGNGSVAIDSITEIEVDWISGNVFINYGSDLVEFEEDYEADDDYRLHYAVIGTTLKIRYQKSNVASKNIFSKNLVLYVSSFRGDIKIESVSGSVQATMVLSCATLEVDTVSSDVSVHNSSIDKVDIDTVSGNVVVGAYVSPNVDVDTVSGEVVAVYPTGIGFRASFESVSGRVVNECDAVQDGKLWVRDDGECKLNVDTVSGNLKLVLG